MFVIATARYEAGSNPCVVYWIGFAELVNSVASGSAFAMLNTALEIAYCIFHEEV
jgi:hypothetical protein